MHTRCIAVHPPPTTTHRNGHNGETAVLMSMHLRMMERHLPGHRQLHRHILQARNSHRPRNKALLQLPARRTTSAALVLRRYTGVVETDLTMRFHHTVLLRADRIPF